MKKRYFITIGLVLVFSALLVLSGCDAILEAMFPEFGDKQTGGNEVWIEVDIDPQLADWSGEVWGKIESANLGPGDPDYYMYTLSAPIDYQYDPQGNPVPKAYLDFWGVPGSQDRPRQYKVVVWIDQNGNQWPDWDEPQAPATWNNFDENDPNNTWMDDTFYFPNEHDWNTIGGYAYLGAKAMNLNFNIKGGFFAIEAGTPGQISTYWFQTEDPDRRVSHVYYEIDDMTGGYWSAQDINVDPPSSSFSMDVDYSNLPAGDYWLYVNVDFEDGSFSGRRYLVRSGTEAVEGIYYDLTIDVNQLTTGPTGIPANTDKLFWVEIWPNDLSGWVSQDSQTMFVDDTGYVTITGLNGNWPSLQSLYYHSYLGSGQDWVRIVIDMNDTGSIDPGDMEAWMPISLMSGDTESVIGIDSWDFYPIF